jgi:uncharacterized protein YaaN involved in tellurite resistance
MPPNASSSPFDDGAVRRITFDNLESAASPVPELNEPRPPAGLGPDQVAAIQQQASSIATSLEQSSGSKAMELLDAMSSLGVQAQRQSGSELALLRTRVGDMLAQKGTGSDIARDLVNLRVALLQIDPNRLSQPGWLQRLFGFIPFIGRSTPALKVLERISARYGTAASQVQVIETRLAEGRMLLARDNIELRQLYQRVEGQQVPIERNIYLGELLMRELTRLLACTEDSLKRERLQNALHDVAMRVQDLRTMQAAHAQFFASIEMTRQNNSRLAQSVERTVSMATNVVTIGLAIQTALARQQRVVEATQRTQEFLGNLLVENAAAIKQHAAEIGDIYNRPVIALDKITQAHRDLIEAIATVDRLKEEGIQTARQNIAQLARMSDEMQGKLAALRTGSTEEPSTLEA